MRPTRRQFAQGMAAGLAGLALPSAVASSAVAAPQGPNPRSGRGLDERAIQDALDAVVQWPAVGAVCSVVGPDGRFDTASGTRGLHANAPARANSVARIASVTKGMVATVALQEVEHGTLSLDSTIGDVLPGLWPDIEDRVTLSMLLNHTSGMPDAIWVIMRGQSLFELDFDELADVVSRSYGQRELVELAKQADWWFEPGTDYGYSNTGYVVVEMMVEAVTGRRMPELIRDRVFRPAGMHRTRLEHGTLVRGAEMQDAAVRPREGKALETIDQSIFASAAAVNTTAADVTRFYQALMRGELVSQQTVDLMVTPVGPAAQAGYGYGLFLVADPAPEHAGEVLVGHDGAGFGSVSLALCSRDGERAFAFTYIGRPYWQEGWDEVFAKELALMRTAFVVNAADAPASRDRLVRGGAAASRRAVADLAARGARLV